MEDFAILYRGNHQGSRLLELKLGNIIRSPITSAGNRMFFSPRQGVKDLDAYSACWSSQTMTIALLRVINVPPREIWPCNAESYGT